MKPIVFILCISLLTISCKRNYTGTADIEGYFMYECGNTDPLGGITLSFIKDGQTLFTSTTDGEGYFEFKGDYSFKADAVSLEHNFIGIEADGVTAVGTIKLLHGQKDYMRDTIYYNNSTFSVLNIECENGSYGTPSDTLYVQCTIERTKPDTILKFTGPFHNGQVLDTIKTMTNPHVGYNEYNGFLSFGHFYVNDQSDWFKNNKPYSLYYPFENGQPNNACGNYTNVFLELE